MGKKCIGCGIPLQNTDSKKGGYTPKDLTGKEELYCQRCFRISHYGEHSSSFLSREDYQKELQQWVSPQRLALAIFDIIDFEGSFQDDILDILREMDSIVVINKVDLIPGEKHPSEVANWVNGRLASEGIAPLDIAIVSCKNNYGMNGILRKIHHFYPNGVEVLVLGVTNVGKSSVVNRLLGENRVTVSKYPGTTLLSTFHEITGTKLRLIDTPGLIPGGRFSDLVIEEDQLKIIPSTEISRKTFKLEKNRCVVLGELIKLQVLNEEGQKPIFSLYASQGVQFHETNSEKASLQTERVHCLHLKEKGKFRKEKFTIAAGEELVWKGLAWLSVKRGPLHIEVEYPEGGDIVIRKAFIHPRRVSF
ncbi:MAG: ribosome biogenesis GTPase YqeH [Fusobacterium necrophorum]|nr:ribosome biogenesis GTPase YqeH [Fusobacterium necrophorum]